MTPTNDNICVELILPPQQVGRLLMPNSARQKTEKGRVVAVGPGKLVDGVRQPIDDVKPGDVVIWPKWANENHVFDYGDQKLKYLFLRRDEIMAVIDE